MKKRKGRQTPTVRITLPYKKTDGKVAAGFYNKSGRTAQEWQVNLLKDILAIGSDGMYVHSKYGYSVPRRNGKSEVVLMRELYGLEKGEVILHTAHKVSTSSDAARKLSDLLKASGYEEVIKMKKDETYDHHFTYIKQVGAEKITLLSTGGTCSFKTRTSTNALGLGVDLLVIDEAQEYTVEQETSLKYVVTDSQNPQTIMCGTPPTAVSSGTVFKDYRTAVIDGRTKNSGWAEWSVSERTDPNDSDAWYETNPSLGTTLLERNVADEVGDNDTDFQIQRLGLWIMYNQASAITKEQWQKTQIEKPPRLTGKLFCAVKYGNNGNNTAMSVACKTDDGRIFVSTVDMKPRIIGDEWILNFIRRTPAIEEVIVDGKAGAEILASQMADERMQKPKFPTGSQYIVACAAFERSALGNGLVHMPQASLDEVVTNCEKKPYSSGFTYRAMIESHDIAVMDSIVLAHWACSEFKERKAQRIQY